MRLSCQDQIELCFGDYRARVAPAAGGRVASLAWQGAKAPVPLLVEWDGQAFDEHDWPKAGAFPMLPFANRLPREGFSIGGRVIRPDPGPNGFALHGWAHRRAWSVVEACGHRVVMRWVHDGFNEGWPWSWSAEQIVELGGEGMTVTLSVRNESVDPMPLGMGWHPYHPADPDVAGGDLRFTAGARRNLDRQGSAEEHDQDAFYGMSRGETAAFTQWDGRLQLRAAGGGTIIVRCRGVDHLVLHRPIEGHYVCAEPVTLLPGFLGRQPELPDSGLLHPGQTQRFSWTCSYVPLPFLKTQAM